jgi:two-component sensor histidine kinase
MILHELAANAAEHGAFKSKGGKVSIAWKQQPSSPGAETLDLHWQEQCRILNSKKEQRDGYGNTLIESIISALGGTVTRNLDADGLSVQLFVPLHPQRANTPGGANTDMVGKLLKSGRE